MNISTRSGTGRFIAVPIRGNSGRQRVKQGQHTPFYKRIQLSKLIWQSNQHVKSTNLATDTSTALLKTNKQINNDEFNDDDMVLSRDSSIIGIGQLSHPVQ